MTGPLCITHLVISQYEMLKLSIRHTTFDSNCTGRSENICSSSGGTQAKAKTRMRLGLPPKLVEKPVWIPSYFVL